MRSIASYATAILAAALLSACASLPHRSIRFETADILPKTDDLPSVEKLPVRAGVYYSGKFEKETRSRAFGRSTYTAPIGKASVMMFDGVFPRVFAQTTQVVDLTPDSIKAENVDVVIAPTIEHFEFMIGADPEGPRWQVVYRMTLYDQRGVPVASWIVHGNGKVWGLEDTIRNDLRDAAENFVRGLERNARPAIAAIRARKDGGSGATVDRQRVQLSARPAELPGLDPKALETLRKGGVIAVRLGARSAAATGLVIRASDVRMRLADGQLIDSTSLSDALNDLDRHVEDRSYRAGAIGGPLVAALVMTSDSKARTARRDTEIAGVKNELFAERRLSRNEDVSGLVLFRLPKEARPQALTVWVVDPPAADGAQVEVPLN